MDLRRRALIRWRSRTRGFKAAVIVAIILTTFGVAWAATTFKWATPEANTQILTTQLNSIADGGFTALSSTITNGTDLFQYMGCELRLQSLSPASGAFTDIWLVQSIGNTNEYASSSSSNLTSNLWKTIQLDTSASTAQTNTVWGSVPPFDFKLQVRNKSGVQYPGSGNILSCRRFNEQGI